MDPNSELTHSLSGPDGLNNHRVGPSDLLNNSWFNPDSVADNNGGQEGQVGIKEVMGKAIDQLLSRNNELQGNMFYSRLNDPDKKTLIFRTPHRSNADLTQGSAPEDTLIADQNGFYTLHSEGEQDQNGEFLQELHDFQKDLKGDNLKPSQNRDADAPVISPLSTMGIKTGLSIRGSEDGWIHLLPPDAPYFELGNYIVTDKGVYRAVGIEKNPQGYWEKNKIPATSPELVLVDSNTKLNTEPDPALIEASLRENVAQAKKKIAEAETKRRKDAQVAIVQNLGEILK